MKILCRSMELGWQGETIQRRLNTPGIPADAREGLLEIKEELTQADRVGQKAKRER